MAKFELEHEDFIKARAVSPNNASASLLKEIKDLKTEKIKTLKIERFGNKTFLKYKNKIYNFSVISAENNKAACRQSATEYGLIVFWCKTGKFYKIEKQDITFGSNTRNHLFQANANKMLDKMEPMNIFSYKPKDEWEEHYRKNYKKGLDSQLEKEMKHFG